MVRLFQALLLWPWISMTTKKSIRIAVLKPNKDLAYMKALFEKTYTTFKPRPLHEAAVNTMLDQVSAWGGALKSLREAAGQRSR